MKIYEKIVIDMSTGETLEEVSYEYDGPIAKCDGGGDGGGGDGDGGDEGPQDVGGNFADMAAAEADFGQAASEAAGMDTSVASNAGQASSGFGGGFGNEGQQGGGPSGAVSNASQGLGSIGLGTGLTPNPVQAIENANLSTPTVSLDPSNVTNLGTSSLGTSAPMSDADINAMAAAEAEFGEAAAASVGLSTDVSSAAGTAEGGFYGGAYGEGGGWDWGDAAKGASQGAKIGSFLGKPGAVMGAVVGGLYGGYTPSPYGTGVGQPVGSSAVGVGDGGSSDPYKQPEGNGGGSEGGGDKTTPPDTTAPVDTTPVDTTTPVDLETDEERERRLRDEARRRAGWRSSFKANLTNPFIFKPTLY